MFYSDINNLPDVIFNLSKCLLIDKIKNTRITLHFDDSKEVIDFYNNDERDAEFERIKEIIKCSVSATSDSVQ